MPQMGEDSTADAGTETQAVEAEALEVLELESNETKAYWLSFSATMDPKGAGFEIDVTGVPNTTPSGGHFVAVFEATGSVPWANLSDALQGTQAIDSPSPSFSFSFLGLSLGNVPYVLVYSTGNDAKKFNNIAAAMPFGAGSDPGAIQPTTVQLVSVASKSLLVNYTTPDGTDPLSQGHSLALVRGTTFFPGRGTVITTASPTNDSGGSAAFDLGRQPLQKGQSYTVAYLTGTTTTKDPKTEKEVTKPNPATVAATVQFTVKS
jgi:hypothetical protein